MTLPDPESLLAVAGLLVSLQRLISTLRRNAGGATSPVQPGCLHYTRYGPIEYEMVGRETLLVDEMELSPVRYRHEVKIDAPNVLGAIFSEIAKDGLHRKRKLLDCV